MALLYRGVIGAQIEAVLRSFGIGQEEQPPPPPKPIYEGFRESDFDTRQFDELFGDAEEARELGQSTTEAFRGYIEESYENLNQHLDSLREQQPELSKMILQQKSVVKEQADYQLEQATKKQTALASTFGGAAGVGRSRAQLMSLAAEQAQESAASTSAERLKEDIARKQLYTQTLQKQNELIGQALTTQAGVAETGATIGANILETGLEAGLGSAIGGANVRGRRAGILADLAQSREHNQANIEIAHRGGQTQKRTALIGAAGDAAAGAIKLFGRDKDDG